MKKHFFKMIFSALLALIMVSVMMPAVSIPTAAAISGKCGIKLTCTLDLESGVLTISGTGEMYDDSLGSVYFPWEDNTESIKTIIIENGVTTIGGRAFLGCENLTSVTIPESVTSIGSAAFCNCTSLKEITIPASVTTLYYGVFSGCSNLETINFEDNSKLTSIENDAFEYCISLESITLPEGLAFIGSCAFANCTKLSDITIPDSVINIGSYAFIECVRLIEKENGISYVDKWVMGCDYGVSPTILRPDTVGIASYAFSDSAPFASIDLPESLRAISDYAFYYKKLTSITIPSNVRYIGKYAFYCCGNLTSITFNENSKLTTIGDGAFEECVTLSSIDIPDSVTTIGTRAFYNCEAITSISLSSNLTSISDYTFYMCYRMTSIELPSSITSIGTYAFYNCSALESIVIPENVTILGERSFSRCHGLKRITICKNSKLNKIDMKSFEYCYEITAFIYCGTKDQWKKINSSLSGIPTHLIKFHNRVDGVCTECGDILFGDVNGDGMVTNADVLEIYRHIYNPELYPVNAIVVDVNKDGIITNADVLAIYKYIYNPTLYPLG